jgi:HTH-type transcriptional regulator/antitoxin HipB
MISKTVQKLSDPQYREAFVSSQIGIGIPFQIRALMLARGWTQKELARRAKMRQPTISALISPGKTRPNLETLRRLAAAFDCGLMVRFAPFSEIVRWSEDFDPDSFNVVGFGDDQALSDPLLQRSEPTMARTLKSASLLEEERSLRAAALAYPQPFLVPKAQYLKRRSGPGTKRSKVA